MSRGLFSARKGTQRVRHLVVVTVPFPSSALYSSAGSALLPPLVGACAETVVCNTASIDPEHAGFERDHVFSSSNIFSIKLEI